MKTSLLALAAALSVATAAENKDQPQVPGFDISRWQEGFDFKDAKANGAKFGIIKVTEGTYYKSPTFSDQWTGANEAEIIRGSYHFAIPSDSTGHEQATYHLKNGGGWTDDGITLPGMLDFEKGPDNPKCFDMEAEEIVKWIKEFSDTYSKKTGRNPMIYTSPDWWISCTGNSDAFKDSHALVLARWPFPENDKPGNWGKVPGGWDKPTFWQRNNKYAHGKVGGDTNDFIGTLEELKKFAKGK